MRIDVADPGSERLALVAALVTAGYEVRAIELRDLFVTRADLVVIAGDAPGALEALRTLRDDGARPDVPVVLVGTPEGTDPIASGPGFGAEQVLARPVDEEKLVSAVRELLRPRPDAVSVERAPELTLELAQRERTNAWRTSAGESEAERDDPSGVSAIHPMNARDDDEAPSPEPIVTGAVRASERSTRPRSVPPPPTGISVVERRDQRPSEMPATSTPGLSVAGFSTPGTGPGTGTGSELVPSAQISDALRTLLAAADRRAFPSLGPLDVSIPAGEASAAELVPDEFLDDAPPADLEPEEETLFLPALPPAGWASAAGSLAGMPPTAAPEASRSVIARTPEPEEPAKKTAPGTPGTMSQRPPRPPPTVLTGTAAGQRAPSSIALGSFPEVPSVSRRGELSATLPDDGSLGASLTDGSRRLALAPGGMLRALLALVLHRGTARVEVWPPLAAEAFATLSFVRGELVAIDGPLQQEALQLARSTLQRVQPALPAMGRAEEDAARERLGVLIERRELSIASSALLTAAAERTLLARLVALEEGEARFQPTVEREAAPRFGRTGPRLVELARALDVPTLARVAGDGVVLAPSRSFDAICEALEVPPEVVALFGRATDGVASSDLARAALVVPGLPGIVLSLFVARALTALSREADGGLDARAAEALVREHAARAEDADYFSLLGVPRDASDAAIRTAREGRTSMLAALPLEALGLGALSSARTSAVEAIEEAASALASPRLRAKYAEALSR